MNKNTIVTHLPIRTERMTIRVPTLDDVDAVQNAKEAREEPLRRWMSWSDDYGMSHEATVKWITDAAQNQNIVPLIAIDNATGNFVLSSGLDAEEEGFARISTGWWLADGYEGRGFAYEAMAAIYEFMDTVINAHTVEAAFYAGNTRSRNLMERLGMTYVGIEHQTHTSHLTGELMDVITYRKTFRS